MTDQQQLQWWREATGRQTPGRVALGLSLITVDGMHVDLYVPEQDRFDKLPKRLIQQLMGTAKPPKAKRQPPVKLASLPYGQQAEYNRVMGREQVAA